MSKCTCIYILKFENCFKFSKIDMIISLNILFNQKLSLKNS